MAVAVAMVLLVSKTQLAVVILPKDAYAHNFRGISIDFLSVSQSSERAASQPFWDRRGTRLTNTTLHAPIFGCTPSWSANLFEYKQYFLTWAKLLLPKYYFQLCYIDGKGIYCESKYKN